MAVRREWSDRKIVSQCRDQVSWAYNGVVFEVKKEIPAKPSYHLSPDGMKGRKTLMERNTKLLALAGLVWLWFGLSAAAHAQFLERVS
jgi:hypothetical protein